MPGTKGHWGQGAHLLRALVGGEDAKGRVVTQAVECCYYLEAK